MDFGISAKREVLDSNELSHRLCQLSPTHSPSEFEISLEGRRTGRAGDVAAALVGRRAGRSPLARCGPIGLRPHGDFTMSPAPTTLFNFRLLSVFANGIFAPAPHRPSTTAPKCAGRLCPMAVKT